ncbi:hypothetical protein HBI26_186530 [Parastagonospora nodorum]|nr:hypothetical protein HBH49_064090 [Parastagonospora nodorum]KAH5561924.1 hypothetical protein HBI26_186530 [Parastagonospora nodorum]
MSASEPNSVPEAQAFAYQSLDLAQRSIRLIRILPTRSREGHIQCEMRNATIEHEYKCLSYVWGPLSNNWITIDGQLHSVRDNLLAFLEVAQQNSISSWLWIDAICIDQINNAERTHQVQQMSHIFSRAIEVIAWLGTDKSVAKFLRYSSHERIRGHLVQAFVDCDYWKRAWVTQELFLALRVTLLAGGIETPLEFLPRNVRTPRGIRLPVFPNCFTGSMWRNAPDQPTVSEWRSLRGKNLVQIVLLLTEKCCALPQDRVYSVLGICGQGSDMIVDYDRTDEELALAVLLSCKRSFCLCALFGISLALDVGARDTLFTCSYASNIWTQQHFDVSISLASPSSRFSERKLLRELLLKRTGRVTTTEFSGVCCEDWSMNLHAHCPPFADKEERCNLIVSIPPKFLCNVLQEHIILVTHDGGINGHCYFRSGSRSPRFVSSSDIFLSTNLVKEHLQYDQVGGTLRMSLALMFWLRNIHKAATGQDFQQFGICDAVRLEQSKLRLYN